jgi:hypothetical protein
MKKKFFFLFIFIIILIVAFLTFENRFKDVKKFLNGSYNNFLEKCTSINGYTYDDTIKDNIIERKTYKCVIHNDDKYKLIKLDSIFVPSMIYGTYCDTLYTTYYDYSDFYILKNRINNFNLPLPKCIRIRKYFYQPGIYFEIKYSGGTKIRTLIDENYNIVDLETVEHENKDMIISILNKIKKKKIKQIFNNTYKRLSFIYKRNPSIRITIDSNIEFFCNNLYHLMEMDVVEFKIPKNITFQECQLMINEISSLTNIPLKYTSFSKFEYFYYNYLVNQ